MILVTSDWHLTDNPRDAYRHAWQKSLRETIVREHVETLFVLGDLTEEKDRHGAWLVNEVVNHLTRLARLCHVIVVRGNHDAINPDNPFYEFVKNIPNITWINAPKEMDIPGLGKVLLLPETGNYKKDWAKIDLTACYWVFTHNTFEGVDVGNGHSLHGIPTDLFGKKALVISGDIHNPQRIGPVIYVGAPYLVDFGDDYKPRMLLIDGDTITSLPQKGPQKRLVDIVDGLLDTDGLNAGDIVKVRVHIAASDHANWPQIQAQMRAVAANKGLTVWAVQPVVDQPHVKASAVRKARARRDDASLVQEYVRQRSVDELTAKTGLALLEKT